MAPGVLHRAGIAIVLIATLLLPYGRCQSPGRVTAHDCCAHHSAPVAAIKANCCTVRSQLPAMVPDRAAANPDLVTAHATFVPAAAASIALPAASVPAR